MSEQSDVFPAGESRGGWSFAADDEQVRELGFDPIALDLAERDEHSLLAGDSWSISIVRHGRLVREMRTANVLDDTRFDLWSITKSFTGMAYVLMLADSEAGALPAGAVTLQTPAYELIPEGQPLSDERKAQITIEHLLTMTAGFLGEGAGVTGSGTATGDGHFELALGRVPNRFGRDVGTLANDPGTAFDYSDVSFAHLSLVFKQATGRDMAEVLQERVFDPLGLGPVAWSKAGGGSHIGPLSVSHTGLMLSARDLARCGLLLLRGGRWGERELLSERWLAHFLTSSQQLCPEYGRTFWLNSGGRLFPGLPEDLFALMGYRSNRCYVIPSLDLVIARVGSGPVDRDERGFLLRIVESIVE